MSAICMRVGSDLAPAPMEENTLMLFCTQCASSSTLVPILSIASGKPIPTHQFLSSPDHQKKKRTNDPVCTLEELRAVRVTAPKFHAGVDLHKRRDGAQSARDALHLGRPDVR